MLFGKDSFRKKNIGKYIIGYELGKQHVQISYLKIGEKEPETLSMVAGQEEYNIPFVLYKQEDKNLWYIGKEALAKQQELGGNLLTDLLGQAYEQELVEINMETYNTSALLALFVKRSLYLPGKECRPEKAAGIMFTVPCLTERMITVLQKLALLLNLPNCQILFQSREESIYHYIIHQ